MSLIKCSECGKDISDKAESCPHCGNPRVIHNKQILEEAPVVTVQQTYKKWKAVRLISWIVVIVGIMLLGGSETEKALAVMFIVFGVVGLIIAKFGAWWTTG